MITEKYTKRDSGETIKINILKNMITIGTHNYHLKHYEIANIIKLYEYDKEVFKEFFENIYIKYDFSMIEFLINNNVTLKEIKEISNIVLFPICLEIIKLSDYDINIIDFFKYIYSQPYEYITIHFLESYSFYLKIMNTKEKLTKYNKFPHNAIFCLNLYTKDKIKRNNKKDIIMYIKNKGYSIFYIEFYGSKCEYYITYVGRKYDLLNDEDRNFLLEKMIQLEFKYDIFLSLSEYYQKDYLYNIIKSFENKKYYTKIIKENVIYILKDNYKHINKKELNKTQNVIVKSTKNINLKEINLLTNNFKKNLYILDYLNSDRFYFNGKIQDQILYNKKNKNLLEMNILFLDFLKKDKKEMIIDNIIIKEIDIIDLSKITKENGYLNIPIYNMTHTTLYLCYDKNTNEKVIIYVDPIDNKHIATFLDKKYDKKFLEKVKSLKI